VGKVSRWVALLSVTEVREFGRISQEEDGCIVGDDIPIALVRPQLDGESTRVTSQIVRSGLATDGGETNRDRTFLPLGTEYIGGRELWDGICAFKVAVGAAALSMNALWDTLAVEV
jgi:hypothetical protein